MALQDFVSNQQVFMTTYFVAEGLSWMKGEKNSPLREETIPELLLSAAEKWPNREALYFCKSNRRYSYQELSQQVDSIAHGFIKLGLKKGDRVGIWSQNRVEWVFTQFATARLGLIMVNINPSCKINELEYVLRKVDCSALIIADNSRFTDYLEIITTLIPDLLSHSDAQLNIHKFPSLRTVIKMGDEKVGGLINFDELKAQGPEASTNLDHILEDLNRDEPINIQFTSGTTGYAKGATLSHANILNNADNVTRRMNLTEYDKLCIPVPLYHCFGMVMGVLGCISKGASMIFPSESFSPRSSLRAIADEKCTAVYGVPTMFISMLDMPGFVDYNLSSLRTGIMAGATCPIEVMKDVVSKMNLKEITIAYGMTETSPVSFQSEVSDSLEQRVTTVGRVHPHLEVKFVDNEGEVVPVGHVGELWTKGYSVMSGYWNDAEKTSEAIQDGWMRTGDLGSLDEEGYCSIIGRLSDMVVRGGENIYPREIENHLYTHPAIQDVQVFGIPHERMGEELCAWIILRQDQNLSAGNISDYCKGTMANYKIPQHIKFVTELPMSVTGKPQKFKMAQAMSKELEQ